MKTEQKQISTINMDALGPRMAKKVQDSINNLLWKGKSYKEITSCIWSGKYEENTRVYTIPFSNPDPKVYDILEKVNYEFGLRLTKKDYAAYISRIEEETAAYEIPVHDKRQTEQELKQAAIDREKAMQEAAIKKQEEEKRIHAAGQLTQSDKINISTSEVSKQVKQKLKKRFPNCTFSVRSEYFSMGSALHVDLMKSDIKVIMDFKDISKDALYYYETRSRYTREQIKELQAEKYHQLGKHFSGEYDPDIWSNGVFLTEEGYNLFKEVCEIVNYYNYDNSDPMTDYFDVNFYFHLNIGKWDKPYIYEPKQESSQDNNKPDLRQDQENQCISKGNVEISRNQEKNSIEVKFPAKPEPEKIQKLKEMGFRWSRYNKLWYKRYTEDLFNMVQAAF